MEEGDEVARRFQRGFLAGRRLAELPWQSLEEILKHSEDSAPLLSILQKTVFHPLCLKYPPSVKYRRSFLSELIKKHESTAAEPLDLLYEAFGDVLNTEETTHCYKNYLLSSGDAITLCENVAIISQGTTGLVTWDAGLYLAEWALENSDIFRNRRILELGSGIGFTGIVICKACHPRTYIFSDNHKAVLQQLSENIQLNRIDLQPEFCSCPAEANQNHRDGLARADSFEVSVKELDWNLITKEELAELQADVVIAADVVYDPELIQHLVGVLQKLSSGKRNQGTPEVYIAFNIRNPDTYCYFQMELEQVPPAGYVTFKDDGSGFEGEDLRYRDVISPINDRDVESSGSREENSSFPDGFAALRTSSSSEGLAKAAGISSEASLESNEDSDQAARSSSRKQAKSCMRAKNRYGNSDTHWPCKSRASAQLCSLSNKEAFFYAGPQDLASFLDQIGCLKYLQVFEEQDVDLRIFLTLTESDLKEIGITLFGPKRKMTSAIARWHSNARPLSDALELAYADRLEAEMQELAIQLHKRCEEVEGLKGQVSQEQELRAVVESCLMEQDVAWSDAQAKLREAQTITRNAGILLEQMQACQAELASRINQEPALGQILEVKAQLGANPKGWSSALRALSLHQLSTLLEECVGEMGSVLCSVNHHLERLQSPEKTRSLHKQP